jgi:hypothetical protein
MRRRSASVSVSFFAFQDINTSVVGIFVLVVLSMILELVDQAAQTPQLEPAIAPEALAELESQALEREREYERLRQSVSNAVVANKWNKEARLHDLQQATITADAEIEHVSIMIAEANTAVAVARRAHTNLEKQYVAAGATRREMEQLGDQAEQLEVQIAELKSDDVIIFRDTSPDGKQMAIVDVTADGILVSDALSGAHEAFAGDNQLDDFEDWLSKKQLSARRFLILVRPKSVRESAKVRELLDGLGASYGFDVLPASKKVRLLTQAGSP